MPRRGPMRWRVTMHERRGGNKMDARRFDTLTQRLARVRLSRRVTIGSGGGGLAALAVGAFTPRRGAAASAPAKQATPATNPDAIEVDGAWFCNQTYAL